MIKNECKLGPRISQDGILEVLSKSDEYRNRYVLCPTYLGQTAKRWSKRRYFERMLAEELNGNEGIKYFAYIKFYLEGDKKYALVVGKSGSKQVNRQSDVRFLSWPHKGYGKEWLYVNRKSWWYEEILVVWAIAENMKENEKEAYRIEKDLEKRFGLFRS